MSKERTDEPQKELTAADAGKLADAVKKLAAAVEQLSDSGLSRRALVVLLADATKVSPRDINDVLNGLDSLGELYLEKAKKR
jgi:hypothetical protein